MLQHGALKRARSENDEGSKNVLDGNRVNPGHHESDYSDEQTDGPAGRQRFEICSQCNEEYDVLHNDKNSCRWHDGKLHNC